MKKQFLLLIALIFMNLNTNAAITATLQLYQTPTPSSTSPGTYNVYFFAGSMANSFCSGVFTFIFQRTQTPSQENTWLTVPAILISIPCQSPNSSCSDFYSINQQGGTKYCYRLKVIFNPSSNLPNDPCGNSPNEYKTSTPCVEADVSMSACFNMLNVNSGQSVNSLYGPQSVKNICGPTVNIDGSCSQNETGYFVSIYEFNLSTWQQGAMYYNGWVNSTSQAPSLINLNNLISQNNSNTGNHPHSSFDSTKTYIITLSVGPYWNSAPSQFFKVVSCLTGKANTTAPITDDNDYNRSGKPKKFTTYPNPTNGVIVIEKTEMDVVLKTITVYDTNNIAIMNITLENENSQRIDLTSLRAGIYLMNVETNEGIFVEKIVKN